MPFKVTYDGEEAAVEPDDCADFEAKTISLASGGNLGSQNVITGRYMHID